MNQDRQKEIVVLCKQMVHHPLVEKQLHALNPDR